MVLSAEVLLIIAVAVLYLYDSAQLLYCNEAVLIPAGKIDWIVGFGSDKLGFAGKELYIPNPFQMHRPLFRLSWMFESSVEVFAPWELPRETLSRLAPLVWSMAVSLFMLLPLGLFTRLGDLILLPALLLLSISILVALTWIWFHRTDFQLSGKTFAGLAFASLICPPFALNLIRHVAMAIPVREDLVSAARRLQNAADWAQTRGKLIARLTSEIEYEDTESKRYSLLRERRQMLINEGGPCQP